MLEVNIYKLEEGFFIPGLLVMTGKTRLILILVHPMPLPLALRFKCPIYTTEDILERSGIVLEFEKEAKYSKSQVLLSRMMKLNIHKYEELKALQ